MTEPVYLLDLIAVMKPLKKSLPIIFFILASLCAIKYLHINEHLSKRPCSMHVWAQCMRASIAENYYEESLNFRLPRLHNVLDGKGITGLEFPFVNYCVALLYKIFGFNEFYFRGFVMVSLFAGLALFFLLSHSILKNLFISLLVTGVCFFSPVLVYYTANFMPDTTSLGLVLMAWYLFFKYHTTGKVKFMYWLFLPLTIAALIKITSLIAFGVMISLLLLDLTNFFKSTNNGKPLIQHKKTFILLIAAGIASVIGWYVYAQWLSKVYHSNAFTLSSEYVTTKKEFLEIWAVIVKRWTDQYYNITFYYVLLAMLLILIVFAKRVSRLLFSITFFTILGSASFFFLMFFQFKDHDYYIIPLLPCVFFLTLTFFDLVVRLSNEFYMPIKYIVSAAFLYVLYTNATLAKINYLDRHSDSYFSNTGYFGMYEDLQPKLREWGIKKHDITLSGSDYTYCNSLYLMNQVGYQFNEYNPDNIRYLMMHNPRVLVLTDTSAFNKAYPNNFKNKIVGWHNGLCIYKLY